MRGILIIPNPQAPLQGSIQGHLSEALGIVCVETGNNVVVSGGDVGGESGDKAFGDAPGAAADGGTIEGEGVKTASSYSGAR